MAPSEGKTVADLRSAFALKCQRISEASANLNSKRAKAQLVASQVYTNLMFRTNDGNRRPDGIRQPPLPKLDTMLEKLQQVSAQEIKAVASKYFNDDALTVGVLDPATDPMANHVVALCTTRH